MITPKFAEGERVTVRASRSNPNIRPGTYTVVRPMPSGKEGFSYRVKSVMDNHERVLLEGELFKV